MKLLTLEKSFRAVFRVHYPQDPGLADQVTLHGMQWCARDPATGLPIEEAARAAHEAYDLLKAAIIDSRVRLHGCLDGHPCGDISPADITTPARIIIFGNVLEAGPGRTYRNVNCYADDIAALIKRLHPAAAIPAVTNDETPNEAVIRLIVAHHDSDRSKDDICEDARAIPGFLISTFPSLWKQYASRYQKRQGRRRRSTATA
jgi:hypothetical protein